LTHGKPAGVRWLDGPKLKEAAPDAGNPANRFRAAPVGERRKAPVEHIVVEHLEKVSAEN
jgi:hypothetical protein